MELSAVREPAPRARLRRFHVRLPQPRRECLRLRLQAAPVGDQPRGSGPPRGAQLSPQSTRPRSGGRRPLRRQPRREHGAPGCGARSIGVGRDDRWGLPDPWDDARVHSPLGGDLRLQPLLMEADASLDVPLARLDRPDALGTPAELPVPRRRERRGPPRPAPLADDPRRQGCLYRPRHRARPLRRGARAERILACPQGQAQPLPRSRPRRVRRSHPRLPRPIRPAPSARRDGFSR